MVVTHGGSTTRIYINGKLDKEQSVARTITDNNEHKFIGKRAWGNYIMDGKIDDVRVFNYARTPAQVAWDYNKGGPVAEWRFDECQGGTVHDESGNGNNGTINLGASGQTANGTCTANANTPWYNGRTGQKNASLNFDGTDDYVGLPTSLPGLNFGAGSFTFSTWIKAGSLTNQANIRPFEIAYCNASPSYITLSLNSNGAIGFGGYDSNGTYSSTYSASGAIDIGNWHHFTAVINRSTNSGQVYIDGKVSGGPDAFSWTGNLNCSTATDSASIGSYGAGGSGFNFQGSLDEFKIFNYALTEDQIKTLYNDGAINFH
jgi:hypothetical protein